MKLEIIEGGGPLLLAQPHGGTDIPAAIEARLNPLGRARTDTDWHIGKLYDGLMADATVVATPLHRYVVDVNRAPDGGSLYPGQNTTGLCPTTSFDGDAIYRPGEMPGADEIAERRERYHRPYHAALAGQLERLRQRHGQVLLYDCHSIRSRIPYLFDGRLPDLNIGTNDGASCSLALERAAQTCCAAAADFVSVCNGRFRGGWTTRHYGKPAQGIHALQMELAQSTYMEERAPWRYLPARAAKLRALLAVLLQNLRSNLD